MGSIVGAITGRSAAKRQAAATEAAAKTQADATKYASDLQQKQYEQTREDLSPYTNAGKNALAQMVGFNPQAYQGDQFTFNGSSRPYSSEQFQSNEFNFKESPSYQFRKQQGMDGIQGSAAARGGLQSGAALKALTNFNSDLASQEYANAFNQHQASENQRFNQYINQEQLNSGQHQQAFNNWQSLDNNAYSRYMTDQNNQYSRLNNLVGIGQNSAAQVGSAGMQTAQAVANNTMAGANAQATGMIGAANARAQGQQAVGQGLGSLIGGMAGLFI